MRRPALWQTVLQYPLQRLWWALLGRIYSRVPVTGGSITLHLLDARVPARRAAAPLASAVARALELLTHAGEGLAELVPAHVATLAVMGDRPHFAAPHLRLYLMSDDAFSESPHAVACRLVWAATVIRLARDRLHFDQVVDGAAVLEQARLAQLRYLQRFDGWEAWADALGLVRG